MDPIRKFRTEKKLTQHDVARILDLQQSDVSKLENGKIDPKLSTLRRIATKLGIDPRGWFPESSELAKGVDEADAA